MPLDDGNGGFIPPKNGTTESPPSYSGVWNLVAVYQAVGSGNWPMPPLTGDNAFIMGGYRNGFNASNTISYVSISSLGSETNFGNLNANTYRTTGTFGSSTRAFVAGGRTDADGILNTIQYVTFATGGSSVDFGDRTVTGQNIYAVNSDTRGVMAFGDFGGTNVMDYVTMATSGNATDFGDLNNNPTDNISSCGSSVRGLFSFGSNSSTVFNNISYITIASAGNATDFGDLTTNTVNSSCGFSSSTRGIITSGGVNPSASNAAINIIQYVTIASAGNATDFGDLSYAGGWYPAGASNKIRGVTMGGRNLATDVSYNNMDYITIASTGNGTDFGDLNADMTTAGAASNANGGLS